MTKRHQLGWFRIGHIFYLSFYKLNGWIQVGTLRLTWKTDSPYFSERYGYLVPFLILGKLRLFIDTIRRR